MHGIRINRSDLVPIIQRRNEIASHLVQKTVKLPDMKRNLNSCKHCHQIRTCTLYHKAIENGTRESSGLGASTQLEVIILLCAYMFTLY